MWMEYFAQAAYASAKSRADTHATFIRRPLERDGIRCARACESVGSAPGDPDQPVSADARMVNKGESARNCYEGELFSYELDIGDWSGRAEEILRVGGLALGFLASLAPRRIQIWFAWAAGCSFGQPFGEALSHRLLVCHQPSSIHCDDAWPVRRIGGLAGERGLSGSSPGQHQGR